MQGNLQQTHFAKASASLYGTVALCASGMVAYPFQQFVGPVPLCQELALTGGHQHHQLVPWVELPDQGASVVQAGLLRLHSPHVFLHHRPETALPLVHHLNVVDQGPVSGQLLLPGILCLVEQLSWLGDPYQ